MQVWLPELSEDGDLVLRTKVRPFKFLHVQPAICGVLGPSPCPAVVNGVSGTGQSILLQSMTMLIWLQGLPFCVAGVGDLLALFRCVSCRYCFGTDPTKPELLGAPGRVFTTQEVRTFQKQPVTPMLRQSRLSQHHISCACQLPHPMGEL